MLKNRIALVAVAGSAALVPVAGIAALTAAPAGAAKAPTGITCTKLAGKVNTTTDVAKITLSGCNGKTGGTGKSTSSASATSNTTTWANGKKTTVTESYASGSGCAAGDVTEDITGSVTADNTKSTTVGAAITATVCFNGTTDKLSLLPGTKYVIAA